MSTVKDTNPTFMRIVILILFVAVTSAVSAQTIEAELKKQKIELFKPAATLGNYVKTVRIGNLLYISGHGPAKADGTVTTGKVGKDINVELAYMAARQSAIAMLSTLKAELGDLNKVKRIIKVTGMVNCMDDFKDHPKVINGFSDLVVSLYGEKGLHARSAFGVNSLPNNMTVEVEMIVEVSE